MFKNSNNTSITRGARLTALLLVVLTVFATASCGIIPGPSVDTTRPPAGTTEPPSTEPPVKAEVELISTVFTSALLRGDIPGPFADSGETVYVSMGVPEGMGGGYREFKAKNASVEKKTGLSLVYAEDIVAFNSKYLTIQTTEATLAALRPELAEYGFTLMDSNVLALDDGRKLSVFYTFTKDGNDGRHEAYCYLLAADGMSVIPFVCRFSGFSSFMDPDVRDRVVSMAASISVYSDGFGMELAEGLESRSYSLYDNLPDGYTVLDVVRYKEQWLAVFALDKANALYVSFFDLKENSMLSSWKKLYDKTEECDIFAAEDGLTVSPAYGKYYTVTGDPGSVKVQLITRTFSDALYSDDGNYRAYIQASGGNVIVEELATGTSSIIYSPRTEAASAGEDRSAELVCFSKDSRLVFLISSEDRNVGFGVYSTASASVGIYENGLAPIGCTATTLWCLRRENGEAVEICRAELDAPEKLEIMYTRGGERKEGFFDNYEDIFFESRITLNSNGSYFVLFPADDASRISLFSSQTYECIYTTPVPNIASVISLDKQIIVGTQGWGMLYTIDLPDKTTPGGSFDHESIVEDPNYAPDYASVMDLIRYSAPYLYRPAKGANSFAAGNIIYFLLNYAADNGLGEEYIEYPKPDEPEEDADVGEGTTEAEGTGVAEAESTTAPADTTADGSVTTAPADTTVNSSVTTAPEAEEEPEGITKYKVQIYTLKKLAWELLGITEDYFEAYITDPVPKTEEIPAEEPEEGTEESEGEAEEADKAEEEIPENAYIGLEGDDRYDRDTGIFYFLPHGNTPSGWSMEAGGTVISHSSNRLTVKTVLVAPDGTRMNAEYAVVAVNDYYRITSVTVSMSLNVIDNLPRFEYKGEKYTALWYAAEKGSNRVYYPLNTVGVQGGGIAAVIRDEKGEEYKNSELVFGEMYLYGNRAMVSVYQNGIYDIISVDVSSGSSKLLGGTKGLAARDVLVPEMAKTGKCYPYYGARLLGASQNGSRVLYMASSGLNKLEAAYYLYDLGTDQVTPLSASLSGSKAKLSKTEHYQWISSSRVRLSVWETAGTVLKNSVYEWVFDGGKWSVSKTDYTTDGKSWYGTGGSTVTETDTEEITTAPTIDWEVPEGDLTRWKDESGYVAAEGEITLEELAELYYEAKAIAISKRENYSYRGVSEYIIDFRSDTYIMMTEYAVYYNAEGKPAGLTKNCQNICQKLNGEWVWTKITLP